jgi:cytochrome P450
MSIAVTAPQSALAAEPPAGPKGWPVVGVLPEIRRDPLDFFVRLSRDYGATVPYRVGPHDVVMMNHPDALKHVLQDNHKAYVKSPFYEPLRPILGDGIFLAEGDEWLSQRRVLTSAFSGPRLAAMTACMADATDDMLDRWQARMERGDTVDVAAEMMSLTLDTAMRALLDIHMTARHKAIYDALTVLLGNAERQVWSLLPAWEKFKDRKACREALRELDAITHDIIEERKANMGEDDLLTNLIRIYGGKGEKAERLLRDQVLSIVVSGHETTAVALSWFWTVLAGNPALDAAIADEAVRVLGNAKPTYETLGALDLTGRAFEETLRLYPPVWTISRIATQDDVVLGTPIAKGTTVMLCAYAIQRHPAYWEDPESFDPDRFLPEREAGRHRYAHIPFGGGPRGCLGKRFGLMEAKVIMSMAMRRFRLGLVDGQDLAPAPMITLRPRGAIEMTVHPRRARAEARAAA